MPTVIKAGAAGPILRRLSTVDLADHLAEADAVLKASQRRRAQLVSEAKRLAVQIRADAEKSGYQAGYQLGYEEGTEAGRREAYEDSVRRFTEEQGSLVADMQRAIGEIDKLKEDLRVAAERDLLDFAVRLAAKLAYAKGRLHSSAVVENLRRALRLVGSRTDVTVRVHPRDVAALKTSAPAVWDRFNASPAVTLVTDDSIAPGGCEVQTGCGRVDATLETQIDEMVSLLLGEAPTPAGPSAPPPDFGRSPSGEHAQEGRSASEHAQADAQANAQAGADGSDSDHE